MGFNSGFKGLTKLHILKSFPSYIVSKSKSRNSLLLTISLDRHIVTIYSRKKESTGSVCLPMTKCSY